MQPREYKITTWLFKGKWNWGVETFEHCKFKTSSIGESPATRIASGKGCQNSNTAYRRGKRWVESYRRRLSGKGTEETAA